MENCPTIGRFRTLYCISWNKTDGPVYFLLIQCTSLHIRAKVRSSSFGQQSDSLFLCLQLASTCSVGKERLYDAGFLFFIGLAHSKLIQTSNMQSLRLHVSKTLLMASFHFFLSNIHLDSKFDRKVSWIDSPMSDALKDWRMESC